MPKTGALTKALAIVGTVLMLFPIVATVGTGVPRSIMTGRFMVDYLMPAELFPVVLVGGVLLLWAALRARARRALVAWGLGAAIGLLVLGQVLAVVTGLASGEASPETAVLPWALVLGSLGVYAAAIVEMGVAGVLLLRDLFRRSESAAP